MRKLIFISLLVSVAVAQRVYPPDSAAGGVPSARTVSTMSPLGGGGALSSNLTLTCATCTVTVASGAQALTTTAISSATCSSAQTATATGTLTTDTIVATFNGDPTAVTGYVPLTTGMLTIIPYPTANAVNFKVCNNTAQSISPGAITLNWKVVR